MDVMANVTGASIKATVPFGTDVTHLVATFTTDGASVTVGTTAQQSGVTANDFSSPVAYKVTAADGTSQSYTVTITAAPSTAKEIVSFQFQPANNPGITQTVIATINGSAISATVPFGTAVTALVATFATTGTSVAVGTTRQVSGTTANDFTNPVKYTVSAGDDSTRDYTVTITIAPSTAKELTAFSFLAANNPGLTNDVLATINGAAIAATVPFGTDVTALVATFATTGASVKVGSTAQVSGTTANDFTSPVKYTVTAADSSTRDFTVTVTIAPSPAKEITSFEFLATNNPGVLHDDVVATINGTDIAATVPFGTDVSALVANFATTGVKVEVGGTPQDSGITHNNFSAPVTYTVTAADTTTKDFTVTVTIAANPAKDITAFQFLATDNPGVLATDVVATISGTDIAATVPFGTDVSALVAKFATTGVTVEVGGVIQASGITHNNFSAPVTYTVTAADTTTKDFTVTVTIAANPAKDITEFKFLAANNPGLADDVIATIAADAITATLPAGSDASSLVATFTLSGGTATVGGVMQESGVTHNDFSAPVVYTVTAADSSSKPFTVTVVVP